MDGTNCTKCRAGIRFNRCTHQIMVILLLLVLSISTSIADDKANSSFLDWLFDEEGEKEVTTSSTYDTFRDANENGIDDRMEKKSQEKSDVKEESTILKMLGTSGAALKRGLAEEEAPAAVSPACDEEYKASDMLRAAPQQSIRRMEKSVAPAPAKSKSSEPADKPDTSKKIEKRKK